MSMIGSGGGSRPSEIRMFLRAETPEELVRQQLRINILVKGQANFADFYQAQDGNHYCWFAVDVDRYGQALEEILAGITQEVDNAST